MTDDTRVEVDLVMLTERVLERGTVVKRCRCGSPLRNPWAKRCGPCRRAQPAKTARPRPPQGADQGVCIPNRGGKRSTPRSCGPVRRSRFPKARSFQSKKRPEMTEAACRSCGGPLPAPKLGKNGLAIGRPRTRCPECAAGKAKRAAPVSGAAHGPNRAAAEETIGALRLAGHLVPVDASRVAALRTTASAVDDDPQNAALRRELRFAEMNLRLSGAASGEIDAYARLMESIGGCVVNCPPRYATPRTDRETLGSEAAAIAEQLGLPLMPHQRLVVDVGLELRPGTRIPAYGLVIVSWPRQCGKTPGGPRHRPPAGAPMARSAQNRLQRPDGLRCAGEDAQRLAAAHPWLSRERRPRIGQPCKRQGGVRFQAGQQARRLHLERGAGPRPDCRFGPDR
jgi:hypothetical protein